MDEFKLRVIYIPANPPSPVPEEEEEEEGSSPGTSSAVDETKKSSFSEHVSIVSHYSVSFAFLIQIVKAINEKDIFFMITFPLSVNKKERNIQ